MLSFEGRVAIVTGAGRGIGRATALALARRGVKLLVNDYGGGFDTLTPGSISVAQAVVDEIVAAGGTAVADGTTVGTGAHAGAIVDAAMAAFGRVDILVNNAGGSQGASDLDGDSDDRVEAVIRTNLFGSTMLVRRVWPVMRRQGYGRIVNTASNGIFGMGQMLAYAVAKGGVIGLTNTAAVEGKPLGILANSVFPAAYTRGVGLRGAETMDWFKPFTPELVGEGIAYLCSSACDVSGEMFRIGGGRFSRYAIYGNRGIDDDGLTAEMVDRRFAESRDMAHADLIMSTAQDMKRFGIDTTL